MAHKRPIPPVPRSATEQGRVAFDSALKENMEVMMGQRGGVLKPLAADATLAEVIEKVNAIIARLQ